MPVSREVGPVLDDLEETLRPGRAGVVVDGRRVHVEDLPIEHLLARADVADAVEELSPVAASAQVLEPPVIHERGYNEGRKKLYYISAEFLIGKLLGNNLINLGLYDEVRDELAAAGRSLSELEEFEYEPSLGNGGLGRLAACFVDSCATLGLPADGIGLA